MSDIDTGAAPAAADTAAIADVQTVETTNPMDRIAQTMGEAYDKINPPRENGRFAAKDKPDGAEPPADQVSDQNPVEGEVKPPIAAIDAPLSWSAEMKAKWANVPPEVQPYVAQREAEAHKRISELGQQVKAFEPFQKHFEPLRQAAARNGASADQGLERLLAANEFLDRDPARAIQWLAEAYGVDLFSAAPAEGDKSDYIRSLESRLERAERLASESHSKVTARERSEQEREQASIASSITEFAKDKPHFEAVRTHMAGLMQTGVAQTLQEAYEMAVYANPETRKTLLEEQRKAEDERREKERAKKAEEAKRGASLNAKSTAASPARKGSWEQTLREVGERLAG